MQRRCRPREPFSDSHEALLEAIAVVPEQSRVPSARRCDSGVRAGVERQLGREDAHTRLVGALRGLPNPASVESVELLINLTLNEFYRSGYEAMPHWAGRAVADAEVVGDPALRAAALAMPALAAMARTD